MRVLSLLLLSFQLTNTVASNVGERKLTTVEDALQSAHENGPYFQGDMVISFQQVRAAFGAEVANSAAARGELYDVDPSNFVPADGRDLALISSNLWTIRNSANNKVQIPYAFLNNEFTSTQETNIVGWLNEMNLECPVEFIARTTEAHYISIQSSGASIGGCSSYVGNVKSSLITPQPLNLGSGCVAESVVKHEFLHAAGFFHEQSRTDRDGFVTILVDNIKDGFADQFTIADNSQSLGTNYDYASIMHYGATFFSKDRANLQTLTTVGKDGGSLALDATLGRGNDLSTGDKLQLKLLYQCMSGPRDLTAYNANPCTNDCQCCEGETGCTADTNCQGTLLCMAGTCSTPPTTATPTTAPVTAAPTGPVTASPTTAPVTAAPTGPVTASPTTAPVTAAPTVPVTASPTTAPVTVSPTTAPVTAAPTPTVNPPPPITNAPTPPPVNPPPPITNAPTTTPTLSPDQVVKEVEEDLDPDTVNALVVGVITVLESVTTESATPGTDSIVVVIVTLTHRGVATLTQEQLDQVNTGLSTFLDVGDMATRRYLQAGSGLELVAVGDATIVSCPEDEMAPCVGTVSEVMFSTMPITITRAPTVKSGKGSKSSGSNSGFSKSGKSSEDVVYTRSPTVPGVKSGKSGNTMKSGKSSKGRRI